jgi:transcriptional regulator with XRE-family HTH domain
MPETIGSVSTAREPRRFLPHRLAEAIAEAKQQSGMSWRELGRQCGVSHSHLIHLARGRRVPSARTVDAIADVLRLDPAISDELRAVAAPMRWQRLDGGR